MGLKQSVAMQMGSKQRVAIEGITIRICQSFKYSTEMLDFIIILIAQKWC